MNLLKRILPAFLAVLLSAALAAVLSSCSVQIGPPDPEPEPEHPEEVTVSFVAAGEVFETMTIPAGEGFTSQQRSAIGKFKITDSHGTYPVFAFYEDEDMTTPYNMLLTKPTEDVSIYCERAFTVTYKYFDGASTNTVAQQTVGEKTGFTDDLLAERWDFLLFGYSFAGFYSDNSCTKNYNFNVAPTRNATVYCDRGMLAGKKITYKLSPDMKTLTLTGEGDMFNFEYCDEVPWYINRDSIETIEIDPRITSVGDCAFYGFSSIKKVTLPANIAYIGANSFYGSSLHDLNFPAALREIGNNAFSGCRNLTHLNFNEGLELIGDAAFYECKSIETVVMTDKIAQLGGSAFFSTTSLTSVYYIGTKAQYDHIKIYLDNFWLSDLANTYFIEENAPEKPGPYWHYDEEGNIRQWYYTVWYMETTNSKLPVTTDYIDATYGVTQRNVDFMNDIVYHGFRFSRWTDKSRRTYNMTVGSEIKSDFRIYGDRGNLCGDDLTYWVSRGVLNIVGTGDMWDFENVNDAPWSNQIFQITSIAFGPEVTSIGRYAFCNFANDQFRKVVIPKTIKKINPKAFSSCIPLLYICYEGEEKDAVNTVGLSSLISAEYTVNAALYYHSPAGETPVTGNYWRNVTDGTTTRFVAWGYADGLLTVGGEETMFNYEKVEDLPWYATRENVTEVVIRPGIQVVGHNSFNGFEKVEKITIPESVTRISGCAFTGTALYEDPENYDEYGVLYITNHLIRAMKPSEMPARYTVAKWTISIAENAFEGCTDVTEIILPHDLRGVYSTGMTGLTGLTLIYFNEAPSAWNNIQNVPTTVPMYFYSATQPIDTEHTYWHYNASGEPVVWEISD